MSDAVIDAASWATRAALERLDARLRRAVERARDVYDVTSGTAPYRGLVIHDQDVDRMLARPPGDPLLWSADEDEPSLPPTHPARRLGERFGLSSFELEVVLLALAPEVDLRYERVYAWLHDDLTRRAPSVSLALDLLCSTAAERMQALRCFDGDAPLRHHGILQLEAPPSGSSGLARPLALDPLVVGWLQGRVGPERIVSWSTWIEPRFTLDHAELPLTPRVLELARAQRARNDRLRLHVYGPSGSGRTLVAEAIAGDCGRPLLIADLERAAPDRLGAAVGRLLLGAALHDAVLVLRGVDRLDALELPEPLAASVVTIGEQPSSPLWRGNAPPAIELHAAGHAARRSWWTRCLAAAPWPGDAPGLADELAETLASRFRLDLPQIETAATSVAGRAHDHLAVAVGPFDLSGHCMAAARSVSSRELEHLATAIPAVRTWNDLEVPTETREQLRELCSRVVVRERVIERWGFGARLSSGLGCNALLAGPPGTGKTLAAEVIACELGLNLYRIDLAAVVSKYIGETEKNLASIFDAATRSNAVLLFDEAEALFGKRSDARDAHDRYANIEVAYLLQRMEHYEGVAVLATNHAQHLDAAFTRRLAFTIHFPFPGVEQRTRIWEGVWPSAAPLADDVDHAWLAAQFKLSGGSIKNAAVAAAHLAAGEGKAIGMDHLRHAIRREFQKLGKRLSDEELGSSPRPGVPVRIAGTG